MTKPKKNTSKEDLEKNSTTTSSARMVERAYNFLRQQAVGFGFHPGERVNEVATAVSLKMSRAPVREALNRLVMKGLFEFEPGKGFFCRKLSVKEVSDLFELRENLETASLRYVVKNATDAEIQERRKSWTEVVARQEKMDIESLVDFDEQFHIQLAQLAGNLERLKILQNINERIRFVRRINLEADERRTATIEDHTRLIEAVSKRDEEKTIKIIGLHLKMSSADLRSHIFEGISRIYANEMA
jgi:DNA-binding GntR family transcriptional regulator